LRLRISCRVDILALLLSEYSQMREEKRIYCKYCGARLKKDYIGRYCPTENCQWQHGLPEDEE
jgi:hypothetical protein